MSFLLSKQSEQRNTDGGKAMMTTTRTAPVKELIELNKQANNVIKNDWALSCLLLVHLLLLCTKH